MGRANPARDCFASLAMTLFLIGRIDSVRCAQKGDLFSRIAELCEDLLRMLAEPGGAAPDLGRRAREARSGSGLAQPAGSRVIGLDDDPQLTHMRVADDLVAGH